VIVNIASDARYCLRHGNADSLQLSFFSNAGLHQQLRRVDRARRKNHIPCGFGSNSLPLAAELNACRAVAINIIRAANAPASTVRLAGAISG
jgi:hypothetical protein